MPEIVVTAKVEPEKLRRMAESARADQLADGGEVGSVEEIEKDLLDGWAQEIAEYGAGIWDDMIRAAYEVKIEPFRPDGEGLSARTRLILTRVRHTLHRARRMDMTQPPVDRDELRRAEEALDGVLEAG